MNTAELEKLIEGQREHPGLDFKASCNWDVKSLTRDILAMSNLPDGGNIIIGVSEIENSFVKTGVDDAVKKTYILDEMKDQVGKYADPMVDFEVFFPQDTEGLFYVVIKVYSFREIPTICKKDYDKELKSGTIYYRNTNRRTESAAISNVNDLRDIIELAAVRLMQRRRSFGFIVPERSDELFKAEIESINKLSEVKTIKSKGYCEIVVTSLSNIKHNSIKDCLTAVQKAQVTTDWDYPVVSESDRAKIEIYQNCYQGVSDFGSRKEIWRMYNTESFYMLNSFVEDWMEDDFFRRNFASRFPSGEFFFYYTSLLHPLTKLFVFLERLIMQGFYKEGLNVSINFGNMADRKLHLDDDNRIPLFTVRSTKAQNIVLEDVYSAAQFLEQRIELSTIMISKCLEYFQYSVDPNTILVDQLAFLKENR